MISNASSKQPADRLARLNWAIAMQRIEDNPLTAEEVAMFAVFEREGWSADKRLAHILALPPLKPVVTAT